MPRSQILPIAITPSVNILISSILFLLICGICGYYNLKQKETIQSLTNRINSYNQTSHSVEPTIEIHNTTISNDQDKDQDPEMVENEAYGTYRPRAL